MAGVGRLPDAPADSYESGARDSRLLLGLAYAAVYFIPASGAAGAGHGTFIFYAAAGPYCPGLLAFPVLGFCAGDLKPFLSKVVFISVPVVRYASVINLLRIDWLRDPAWVEKRWNISAWSILLPAGFYLPGRASSGRYWSAA